MKIIENNRTREAFMFVSERKEGGVEQRVDDSWMFDFACKQEKWRSRTIFLEDEFTRMDLMWTESGGSSPYDDES